MKQEKETQSKRLSIPITPSLYKTIEDFADGKERSTTQQARLFLKKGMEAVAQEQQAA